MQDMQKKKYNAIKSRKDNEMSEECTFRPSINNSKYVTV